MKLLPTAESGDLRWTLLALVFGCISIAILALRAALGGDLPELWVMALSLLLGLGLWLRFQLARWVALALLWFTVILLPFALFSPFAVMEGNQSNPPSVLTIAIRILPIVVVSLLIIHVLGKRKGEFRWWRKPGQSIEGR